MFFRIGSYGTKTKQAKLWTQKRKKRKREDEISVPKKIQKKSKSSSPLASLEETGWDELEKEAKFTYKASHKDQPQLACVKEVNALSDPSSGRKFYGLYATTTVPAGTIIGTYTGNIVSNDVGEKSDYGMELSDGTICDAKETGNLTRFVNFSESDDNCEFVDPNGENDTLLIDLLTKKDVLPGQQYLVNYNVENNFYALHPDHNWKSATECLNENKNRYNCCEINNDYKSFNLKNGDSIYVTLLGTTILEEKKLSTQNIIPGDVNLQFYKKNNETNDPVNFNQFDTFSALMLACYLGQLENVKFLLTSSVDINRRQLKSKRSAIFFALLGVKNGVCEKEQCTEILKTILSSGEVKLNLQDKKCNTFLHYAIKYLDAEQLSSILNIIDKKYRMSNLKQLYNFVNKTNDDLFLFAIQIKAIDKVRLLLTYFPTYIKKNVCLTKKSNNKSTTYCDSSAIKGLLAVYNLDEMKSLKKIFKDYGASHELLAELFSSLETNGQYGKLFSDSKLEQENEKQDNKRKDRKLTGTHR